jgi:hypothetical protein
MRANRCFTLGEIHEKFPQISRLLIHKLLRSISTTKKKNCASWVLWMLTEEQKSKRMGAALMF